MSYTNCNKMPGIVAVKWIHADELPPHIVDKFIAGLPVALDAAGNELELVEVGSAEGLETVEHNGLTGKATLEFKTLDDVPKEENIVWAAMDADGKWWLIGAREKPYPVVEATRRTGTPGGEPAVTSVKVTRSAKIALIPVDILQF